MNRSPAPMGTLPNRTLALDDTVDVDVSGAFVDPDGDALAFTASSSAPQVVTASMTGAFVILAAASEGAATIRVTATDPGGLSATQVFTVTVEVSASVPFTDHPIRPGVTPVKAVHFTELRARIDAVRRATSLPAFSWTDSVLSPGVTQVKLVHLRELREALGAAYVSAGRLAPGWTDPAPMAGSTPISAEHVMELRAAVVALECPPVREVSAGPAAAFPLCAGPSSPRRATVLVSGQFRHLGRGAARGSVLLVGVRRRRGLVGLRRAYECCVLDYTARS